MAAALLPRKDEDLSGALIELMRASMWPRHCCRGKPSPIALNRPFEPGFNVAAALLPRKELLPVIETGTTQGFNVAAALLPRKVY